MSKRLKARGLMRQVMVSITAGTLKAVVDTHCKFPSPSDLDVFLLLANKISNLGCLPVE